MYSSWPYASSFSFYWDRLDKGLSNSIHGNNTCRHKVATANPEIVPKITSLSLKKYFKLMCREKSRSTETNLKYSLFFMHNRIFWECNAKNKFIIQVFSVVSLKQISDGETDFKITELRQWKTCPIYLQCQWKGKTFILQNVYYFLLRLEK